MPIPYKLASAQRVTVAFRSDRGRDYLYDDVTGSIFPWNDLRESALHGELTGLDDSAWAELAAQYGAADLQAARQFVRHWRERYGAFVRTWGEDDWVQCPPPDELERLVRQRAFELLLVLTENCNMRCAYCALSKVYPLNRTRTSRHMTLDTAKRAVDWYVQLVEPQRACNPRKRFGLSLFGGEPMMNMDILEGILIYCRDHYPDTFVPVMSTNGTLLTPSNVELLVEHEVKIAISIDGPEREHDRLRVDAGGGATFARIMRNLERLRRDYPDYWLRHVSSLSVYDWGTDLIAVERFFEEHDEAPRSLFVSPVGTHNTEWYARYNDEDRNRMLAAMSRLVTKYKRKKIAGETMSHYLSALVGMGISLVLLRRRGEDVRPPFLPFGDSCIPGDKVAVQVDGKIDICERVNGTYPIGHLDRGGIDFEGLRGLLRRYRQDVLMACPTCPVTKHCSVCFARVDSDGGFRRDPQVCADIMRGARRRMADYVSILEENPQAEFHFETDTARIEERLLFLA